MNHARAKHLYPARVLTGTTAFTIADGTVYIHLGAGFGEGEVTTTEAHTSTFTEELASRSEEHTSELQSHSDLVCRLLLEKKTTSDDARPVARTGEYTHERHAARD